MFLCSLVCIVIHCCSKSDPKTILLQLKDAIEQVTKDNVGAVPIHFNHCFSKDLSLVTNPPARKAALEKLWNKVRRNIFAISITRFFYTIRKYINYIIFNQKLSSICALSLTVHWYFEVDIFYYHGECTYTC